MCACACLSLRLDKLRKSVLSYLVCPRDGAQRLRLRSRHLYVLIHLASPAVLFYESGFHCSLGWPHIHQSPGITGLLSHAGLLFHLMIC